MQLVCPAHLPSAPIDRTGPLGECNTPWTVPLEYTEIPDNGSSTRPATVTTVMSPNTSFTIKTGDRNGLFLVNPHCVGLYRVNYPHEPWNRLAQSTDVLSKEPDSTVWAAAVDRFWNLDASVEEGEVVLFSKQVFNFAEIHNILTKTIKVPATTWVQSLAYWVNPVEGMCNKGMYSHY
ncbi:hypothetical protein SeMB42_g01207 [Synchytrium endobioticum]|uniref:Uncharacterized protein n=1 Tax=Synchytrium endobioticum TaxID=286115 RepID=A0A507DNF0_9FUNG|nr:hypothetical protein SeMB42_g01207 [Synchytrium endobioticum]